MKVAQLAGYVAEHTAYHHGEVSLHGTIINMAQDFVGSNNIPLLYPSGQFGTRHVRRFYSFFLVNPRIYRLQGGKDAASARYIFTKLATLTRSIFPKMDDPILHYLEDDGELIQPEYFVSTLEHSKFY